MVIDKQLLDEVSFAAKASPRLRMNYNFHQSLEDKCHRFLNAVEPGTDIPIHRHPDKDESFVVLRGRVCSTTYNDDGSVIESIVLCAEEGCYGVDIPKGVWHKLESLESGSVVFECKEGPFVAQREGLSVKKYESLNNKTSTQYKKIKAFFQRYLAVRQLPFCPPRVQQASCRAAGV